MRYDFLINEKYVFENQADIVHGAGDQSDQATIITTGIEVHEALKAAEMLEKEHKIVVRVLNVASIRPIDASAIIQAALETAHLLVVEDHSSEGGLASQVADIIADFQLPCSLRRLGVNHYFPSATDTDLRILAGLDAENIVDIVQDEVKVEVCGGEDAIVTVLHALPKNRRQSRFEKSAASFVEKLQNDRGYLESLRKNWKRRAVPEEKFPTNETLREEL